jgi:hypothetical protein
MNRINSLFYARDEALDTCSCTKVMVFHFMEGFGVSHTMEEIKWLGGKEKCSCCIIANGNYMLFALLLILL